LDERGRLWVIETVDYPNEIKKDDMGDDRIKILEDTDGDGKADKSTIFAEKLNIPTSFVFSNGGIIVSQSPSHLFLKDTTGDDKADVSQEILSGWGKKRYTLLSPPICVTGWIIKYGV
jgi:putative membrane-bound dehydrogenase-like protein